MSKSTRSLAVVRIMLVVLAGVFIWLPSGKSQDTNRYGSGNSGFDQPQRTGIGAVPAEFGENPMRGFEMEEMRGNSDGMAMRGISPNMLLRIRADLTAELREIQRAIGFLDPNDARLAQVFNARKNEALQQLKEIDAQLKSLGIESPEQGRQPTSPMGIPAGLTGPTAGDGTNPATATGLTGPSGQMMFGNSRDEKGEKTVPGFGTGGVMAPNANNPNDTAGWDPRMEFGNAAGPGRGTGTMTEMMVPMYQGGPAMPTSYDPWQPQPGKEMVELKQSVSSLQNEVKQLRDQIQSLETQIQLLTRSILQSTTSPR